MIHKTLSVFRVGHGAVLNMLTYFPRLAAEVRRAMREVK